MAQPSKQKCQEPCEPDHALTAGKCLAVMAGLAFVAGLALAAYGISVDRSVTVMAGILALLVGVGTLVLAYEVTDRFADFAAYHYQAYHNDNSYLQLADKVGICLAVAGLIAFGTGFILFLYGAATHSSAITMAGVVATVISFITMLAAYGGADIFADLVATFHHQNSKDCGSKRSC